MTTAKPSTLTFVFTDIEGSTQLLRALGDRYVLLLRAHDRIISEAAAAHGGKVFGSEGDAQWLVFEDASAAVAAAVLAQRELADHEWVGGHRVRVRMGIHTGLATRDEVGFVGMALHEVARISATGHGGQVLLSPTAAELAMSTLPRGVGLRDLGEHRFRDIQHPLRIRQLEIEGLASEFPPLRTDTAVGNALPRPVNTFVGRSEVKDVVRLVTSSRLLTLTGPGGIGKTRLAIEVAERTAHLFRDGTWFVALDAVREPELVPSEIATVLGVSPDAGPPLERLISHLSSRTALLLLDNLEQVIEARVAIGRIIAECEGLTVLATSRIPLGIYGEQEFPVPALSVPPDLVGSLEQAAGFESVRLFEERAQAAKPAFALDDENAATVAEIVALLDGLPLAIELAAARVRMLPLPALRARLDDRLGTLDRGAADRPDRQRTLRGAIGWSHELLDAPDRRLFARFGAVAASAALTQVEAIAGPADELGRDVFDGLESLTQQSLLVVVESEEDEPRFTMLSTIREYAREQLRHSGESEAIRRRHAMAYLELAERAGPKAIGADAATANDRLERDHDELRDALEWSVANDEAHVGLRLIVALWRFWQVRGHLDEADERVHTVLAIPSVASQTPELRARAETAAGGVAYWRSQHDATLRHYQTALELARQTDDRGLLADALLNLGFTPFLSQDPTGLERTHIGGDYFTQAMAIFEDLDDQSGIARTSWALAIEAAVHDQVALAREWLERSLAAARSVNDIFQIGWSLHLSTMAELVVGDTDGAAARMGEALDIFVEAGDISATVMLLLDAALVARYQGREADAWQLLGAEDRLRSTTGADIGGQAVEFASLDDRRMPETDEQRTWFDHGQSLATDEAIALARAVAQGRPTP